MTTYNLTISTKYVPSWGTVEGVREIFQNAIDADKKGFPMSYSYSAGSKTLVVHNEGAVLPISSLLMGENEKHNDDTQIGENGEGYKLGTLALLRDGKRVTIFNRCAENPQRWDASLDYSKKYEARIVSFKTSNIKSSTNNLLTFKIRDITPDEWELCQKVFLDSGHYGEYNTYEAGHHGNVLCGPKTKGMLFVGGLLIQHKPDLDYGYNFNPGTVTLNRDRTIVESWSLEYHMASMWNLIGTNDSQYVEQIEAMLMKNSIDVRLLSNNYICSNVLSQSLAERFKAKYGKNAHPVQNKETAKSVGFYNVEAVPTGETYSKVLEYSMGDVTSLIEEKRKEPTEILTIPQLNDAERDNITWCNDLIRSVSDKRPKVEIAEFVSKDVLGLCNPATQFIYINVNILKNKEETLKVMVHEWAHLDNCPDDEVSFNRTEADLWCKIVFSIAGGLRNRSVTNGS